VKVYLDANIFAFAELDIGGLGERARALLRKIKEGEMEGYASALTIDELLWVFVKNRQEALMERALRDVYELPNCTVLAVGGDVLLLALKFMKKYSLKPRDAMHCAVMQKEGLHIIASDDRDFDKVKEIKRRF